MKDRQLRSYLEQPMNDPSYQELNQHYRKAVGRLSKRQQIKVGWLLAELLKMTVKPL